MSSSNNTNNNNSDIIDGNTLKQLLKQDASAKKLAVFCKKHNKGIRPGHVAESVVQKLISHHFSIELAHKPILDAFSKHQWLELLNDFYMSDSMTLQEFTSAVNKEFRDRFNKTQWKNILLAVRERFDAMEEDFFVPSINPYPPIKRTHPTEDDIEKPKSKRPRLNNMNDVSNNNGKNNQNNNKKHKNDKDELIEYDIILSDDEDIELLRNKNNQLNIDSLLDDEDEELDFDLPPKPKNDKPNTTKPITTKPKKLISKYGNNNNGFTGKDGIDYTAAFRIIESLLPSWSPDSIKKQILPILNKTKDLLEFKKFIKMMLSTGLLIEKSNNINIVNNNNSNSSNSNNNNHNNNNNNNNNINLSTQKFLEKLTLDGITKVLRGTSGIVLNPVFVKNAAKNLTIVRYSDVYCDKTFINYLKTQFINKISSRLNYYTYVCYLLILVETLPESKDEINNNQKTFKIFSDPIKYYNRYKDIYSFLTEDYCSNHGFKIRGSV